MEERRRSELTEARTRAMSIESMPEESGPAEYIGEEPAEDGEALAEGRVILLYRDRTGGYWYRTAFKTGNRYISEYEHIFGKQEKRRKR